MHFKVENKIIDKAIISLPAKNYGQMWRYEKFKKVNYEIQVSPEGFFEKTSEWFKEFRVDAIKESRITNKGDFPVYDKYEVAGFSGLIELMNLNKDILSEIILFHDLDILNALLNHEIPETGDLYIINSLDQVLINEYLLFKGIAFKVR